MDPRPLPGEGNGTQATGTSPPQVHAGPPQCLGRSSVSPSRTWAPEGPAAFLSCVPATPQPNKAQQGCRLGGGLRTLVFQCRPCTGRCLRAACCRAHPHSAPGALPAFSAHGPNSRTPRCPLTPLPEHLAWPPAPWLWTCPTAAPSEPPVPSRVYSLLCHRGLLRVLVGPLGVLLNRIQAQPHKPRKC